MSDRTHGLVVGKFYPLHAGHQHLIRFARARCDELTVCLLASRIESIPLSTRRRWLEAEHPDVRVVSGWDEAPMTLDDPDLWAAHVTAIEDAVGRPVDVVFTSEDYGDELARRLGAAHVLVDRERVGVPVSGSAVRADVAGYWWALPPAVRASLVRRVVVLGAESTGTTTLTADLAAAYATSWAEEFGRVHCYERPGGLDAPWTSDEFELIAERQLEWNEAAARRAAVPVVFFDTDPLATAVWHERYVGRPLPTVVDVAATNRPDLYVLTRDDVPFVQDGWRDGEHVRASMTQRLRDVLTTQPVPWVEVHGAREERVVQVRRLVDAMVHKGWGFADPIGWQQSASTSGRDI